MTRPNQVWATDITYVPMARGFVYLVAIVDRFTRRVLAWRVSILLDAEFCIKALEEALASYGKPAISNSDRGSQFTSTAFHRRPPAREDRHQHGRQRLLARQTCSWSACGARRNMRRCISTPTPRSPRPALTSAIHGVLQCRQAAFRAWRPHARPRILRPAASRSGMINQRRSTYSKPRACADKPSHL